jgi:hypothetical protein
MVTDSKIRLTRVSSKEALNKSIGAHTLKGKSGSTGSPRRNQQVTVRPQLH